MGGAALATLSFIFFTIGAICGLVSMAVLAKTKVPRSTAFGWGAVLGPIGLVVAGSVAAKRSAASKSATQEIPTW